MIFNKQQLLVINEHSRNLLIKSLAGTGKTNVLAHRIAKILELKKTKEQQILCITFTNKACKELQSRLTNCIGEAALNVSIKTIHGFCYDVIRTQAKQSTDVFKDFTVLDEEDCKSLVKEIPQQFPQQVKAVFNFIYKIKHTRCEYEIFSENAKEDLKKTIAKLYNEEPNTINKICVNEDYSTNIKLVQYLLECGHEIIENYNNMLQDSHSLDFVDLIIKTFELFNDKSVLESWQKKYSFINIDEVQDTSYLEYKILKLLFPGKNVLLCGDINQTIYEWRGSTPLEIIKDFKVGYDPLEITFEINYRATPLLVNLSHDLLTAFFAKGDFQVKANNTSNNEEKVSFYTAATVYDEADFILNSIKKISDRENTEVCILTRDNNYNKELSFALKQLSSDEEKTDIDFMLVDDFQFFKRSDTKDIMAFLKLLANPFDSQSFIRIISRFVKGVGSKTIENLTSNQYLEAGIKITDFQNIDTLKYADPYFILTQSLQDENIIVFDVESTGINITRDEIIQIAAIKLTKDGSVKEKFIRFLKTNRNLENSQKVHGFTKEFIDEKGEPPAKVLNDFIKFAKDTVIVGHNVSYDINILESQLKRENIDGFTYSYYYDTLDIYRRFYPKEANYKLEYLSKKFNTQTTPNHDAYNDILATKELLLLAIKEKIQPTTTERVALICKHKELFLKIAEYLQYLRLESYKQAPDLLVQNIIERTGISKKYEKQGEKEKIANLKRLCELVKDITEDRLSPRDNLIELVKITVLSSSEFDQLIKKRQKIPIITVHQAKGLEFSHVFLAGLSEDVFPSFVSRKNGNIEEEKRLFYVAITRAKKKLYLSFSKTYKGRNKVLSNFVREVPNVYLHVYPRPL